MNDIELRAHEFALEMTKVYCSFSLDMGLKTATKSGTIKFDCDEAIKIYKAVFEKAKKEFAE